MVFNNNLLLGAAGQGGGAFDPTLIGNSVWFNGTDSRMDSPAFSAQSDPTCFTFATWVQILDFSISPAGQYLWSAERTGNYASIRIDNNNKLVAYSNPASFTSDMIFRDIGWYHIICSYKGSANTVRMFVNGVEISNTRSNSLATNPEPVAFSHTQRIGAYYVGATGGDLYEANSYLAQTVFLDGFSFQDGDITVSDFLDTFTFGTNGSQFIPKKDSELATLAGTAGANSYVLDYADSSNLGNDISSKNNDFTLTNMSSANQSSNTPSLTYPLLNPLSAAFSTPLSNGNTTASGSSGNGDDINPGIIIPSTGKWAWKITNTTAASLIYGVRNFSDMKAADYTYTNLYGFYAFNGTLVQGAGPSGSYLPSESGGDIYIIYYDADSRKMWVSKDGTIPNSGNPDAGTNEAFTIPDSGFDLCPTALVGGSTPNSTFDFGLDGVSLDSNATTFKPLTSANLTAPDYQGIDYFNAVLYTGNGTAIGSGGKAVTGVGFKPDFTWIKNRDAADSYILTDVVRGVTKYISSDSTAVEATNTEALSTFDTDGFTVGNLDAVNTNTENYVSWNWLAGGTGSSNSDGSIASTVTVANAGHLSVGTYVGSGANATIGHGLGGVPEMIIVKNRDQTDDWPVYHVGTASDPETDVLYLNLTLAVQDSPFFWNDTAPTTSVFSIGTGAAVNTLNENYVFYTFRSVPGVCKVGSYEANNNADGPYISTGFKVAATITKPIDVAGSWMILDDKREPENPVQKRLFPNSNAIEDVDGDQMDFYADGFKLRKSGGHNGSGTYLYIAMADIGGNGTLPPIYGR